MRIGVVGAGVIGCAIARELARRGADVDLFDGRGVGAGATQASAGALVPFVEAHDPGPLQELTVRSLAMYDDFIASVEADAGAHIDYARCGSLELALTDEEEVRLRDVVVRASGASPGLTWLDRRAVEALQPFLSNDVRGGLLASQHAYVSARELTEALASAFRRLGGRVHGLGVTHVGVEGTGVVLRDASGRVSRFDRVVLAAGAWGSLLDAPGVGVPRIHPVKGQLLRVGLSRGRLPQILWSAGCYVVPQESGDVLVGATMEEVGFDESPTAAAAEGLLGAFRALVPGVEAAIVEQRVGLRPASSDHLPIIGPSASAPSVVFALGHFRNGIVLAPLTAQLVADLLEGRSADPVLTVLRPDGRQS